MYEKKLKYNFQRFSNNSNPEFTDQEAMTVYLYSKHVEHRFKVKHIYEFASEHLRSRFPELPSYVAYTNRINRLSEAFKGLTEDILTNYQPPDCDTGITLIDTMPVITCSGKRSAKVAPEITGKGYCSAKGMYYHGLKLHALGFSRKGHLPHPERLLFSKASVNDLTFLKEICDDMYERTFFGDKICGDKDFWQEKQKSHQLEMLTPIKGVKGQTEQEKQRDKAYVDLFSAAVSSVREPIESLFNWLIEKTDIQRAGKVRSTEGLLTFVCGRLAAAFIDLIF
jgi:hypothetical protein